MAENVVHLLQAGRALCGMKGVPGEWPDGHRWVSYYDEENAAEVNCMKCLSCLFALEVARPTDKQILALRTVCMLTVRKGGTSTPIPIQGIIVLCNEIIEARALAAGAIEDILNTGAQADGFGIKDRPTDADLAALAHTWRRIVAAGGPRYKTEFYVLAMLTLAEEVIELRKAPRA